MSLFGELGTVLGFTGTQKGMSDKQKREFLGLLVQLTPTVLHHGDCVGADADAHDLVKQAAPGCRIVVHPPVDDSRRAFCEGATRTLPALPYLTRNQQIVRNCTLLVATPRSRAEELRSGTWATVRYARQKRVPVHIIYP